MTKNTGAFKTAFTKKDRTLAIWVGELFYCKKQPGISVFFAKGIGIYAYVAILLNVTAEANMVCERSPPGA